MNPNEAPSFSTQTSATDLAIVGAGPAGMAAAVTARQFGASVVVLDEQQGAGGQIYRGVEKAPAQLLEILGPDYQAGTNLFEEFVRSGAEHVRGASVWHVVPQGKVHFTQAGAVKNMDARRVVLCTGALERPFPIPGWTLPGVLTAGAAQILLKGSGMRPSEPVILAGCGPLLYLLGWQYVRAGVAVKAIVDTTEAADYRAALPYAVDALIGWRYLWKGAGLMAALKRANVTFYSGAKNLKVLGDSAAAGLEFESGGRKRQVDSPVVLLHQGVVPNTQFTWALRATHVWDELQLCWKPSTDRWGELDVRGIFVAGDGRGIGGANVAALQGRVAGLAAAAQLGRLSVSERDKIAAPLIAQIRSHLKVRPFLDALYRPKRASRVPSDETVICRCEEVTAGALREYVDLGCSGPNQVKSYGRCGMGPCQGRQCGLTVAEVIADARGIHPRDVGYFRIRPPIKPITLGELANGK